MAIVLKIMILCLMINIQKNGELQNYEGEDDHDLDAVMMKMTIWF